jgi:hypothetical protein
MKHLLDSVACVRRFDEQRSMANPTELTGAQMKRARLAPLHRAENETDAPEAFAVGSASAESCALDTLCAELFEPLNQAPNQVRSPG